MLPQQALATERLILRPLTLDDASRFQQLAGRREIADTMVSIPHPCSEEQARDWITAQTDACAQGKSMIFAIESKATMQLIGTVGLRDIAEVGQIRGRCGLRDLARRLVESAVFPDHFHDRLRT